MLSQTGARQAEINKILLECLRDGKLADLLAEGDDGAHRYCT